MESTRLLAGIREAKVRERVRKFFNPEFNSTAFRDAVVLGFLALLLGELLVYLTLQESAELGELPQNITDILIIGISFLEFLLLPVLSWLGSRRRRSVMVWWTLVALVCTVSLFALPDSEVTADAGLCTTAVPLSFATGITTKSAIRLSMLLICGLVYVLARCVFITHALAYLYEYKSWDNVHMHVGIFVLHRVMVYLLGRTAKSMFLDKPWVQILIICIKFLITLIRLHRYPDVNPALEKRGSNGGLFRSMGRVLRSGVAVLMILSMSLMGAAWWGFGANGTAFAQVKYQIRADLDSSTSMLNLNLRLLPVILGVLLAGYMYTAPVMPKLDRKASVASSARMCFLACLVYILMTATLDCEKNGIQGLETGYSQPACGLNCRCDRPWMEFNPVCVPEQMMTYFSPCHAGCATADTVNNVAVYSNCTCAPGGRVIIGSCDDGSCSRLYSIHQLFFAAASVASTLAFIWQTSVVLETIDKRDIAMAVALVSGVVSMFTFIGGYGYYLGISYFTCAYTRDIRCLLQNDHFVPWVGYSSATLAGVAFIITIITCIIIRRQPEPKEDDLDL